MDQNNIPTPNILQKNREDYKPSITLNNIYIDIPKIPQETFSASSNIMFNSSSLLKSFSNNQEVDEHNNNTKTKIYHNYSLINTENFSIYTNIEYLEDDNLEKILTDRISGIHTLNLFYILKELHEFSSNEKNKEKELNELLLQKKIINELIKRVILEIKMRNN